MEFFTTIDVEPLAIPDVKGACQRRLQRDGTLAVWTDRLRVGDEEAWREFHAEFAPRLRRYLWVATAGSDELAEEVLQSMFLRTVKHMRVFHFDEAFWGWCTTLARSALIDEIRRRRRGWRLFDRWRPIHDAFEFAQVEAFVGVSGHDSEEHLAKLLNEHSDHCSFIPLCISTGVKRDFLPHASSFVRTNDVFARRRTIRKSIQYFSQIKRSRVYLYD